VSKLRLVMHQCAQGEIGQQIQKHAEGCRQMPALVSIRPGKRVAAARVCHHRMSHRHSLWDAGTLRPCNPPVFMYPMLVRAGGLSFCRSWPSTSSSPAGRCSLLRAISLPYSLLANHESTTNPPGRPPAFPFPAQSPFTASCRRWVVVPL